MKKEEYIKLLNDDPAYKICLSKATSASEKRIISAYAEDFINKFFREVVEPTKKILEKDPEALNKAYLEVQNDLINNSSGSQGT